MPRYMRVRHGYRAIRKAYLDDFRPGHKMLSGRYSILPKYLGKTRFSASGRKVRWKPGNVLWPLKQFARGAVKPLGSGAVVDDPGFLSYLNPMPLLRGLSSVPGYVSSGLKRVNDLVEGGKKAAENAILLSALGAAVQKGYNMGWPAARDFLQSQFVQRAPESLLGRSIAGLMNLPANYAPAAAAAVANLALMPRYRGGGSVGRLSSDFSRLSL